MDDDFFDGIDASFGGDPNDGISMLGDDSGSSGSSSGFGATPVPDSVDNSWSSGNLGSTTSGLGGTGFNWSSLIGPALGAVSGYAQGAEKEKLTKEQEALAEKLYAAKAAVDEQYYQAHGAQLSKAVGNFKQYAPTSNAGVMGGLGGNPGGVMTPMAGPQVQQPQQQQQQAPINGLLSYGY